MGEVKRKKWEGRREEGRWKKEEGRWKKEDGGQIRMASTDGLMDRIPAT
jgi:hypothetical protein